MAKKNKKLNKQIKDAFVLTSIICILAIILYKITSLVSAPTDTFVVRKSTIFSEESAVGYVIREEHIIEGTEESQSVEPIKSEGERVSVNQPIFKYYNEDEKEKTKQIDDLNNKIQEALLGQKDLFPGDIKAIEGQIEEQIEKLKNQNNMQYIKEYKNNISDYIVKKAKIAGSLSSAGIYINNLISERNSLEIAMTEGSKYVYSDTSGVVSYRIDGLEEELNQNKIENITLKDLNSLDLATGQIVNKSSNKVKIINNFECYIAVGIGNNFKDEARVGKQATLRLSSKEEVKAEIYKVTEEGNQLLVIFKITDGVENLIDYRKISLDVIWWRYTGLMVPKSSIIYENGLSYVLRKSSGEPQKILVNLLKENESYCIIDSYNTEELSEMGYTTDEINSIKNIKLYDEIIVNPDIK